MIIVTGASQGIGWSIAAELAARGHDIVGLSRSGNVPAGRGICCDVTDESAVAAAIADVAASGPITGLVNNAGIHLSSPSASLTLAEYERVMSVNATSTMLVSREAYPHLKKAGGGMILNLGSFFDKVGVAGQLAYSASKAAMGAMTRVLAVEWAKDGIAVLNVAPGYVETELSDFWQRPGSAKWIRQRVPVGRGGTREEVARLVGALFGEDLAYLTGETIYMDGAHSLNH